MKREVVFVLMFILIFASFSLVHADEASQVEQAYTCLSNRINQTGCASLTLEERAFSALASGECRTQLSTDNLSNQCWPKAGCKVKSTAEAVLALKDKVNTTKAEKWLLSQTGTPSGLDWFLEIEINDGAASSCVISYNGASYTIKVNSDKTIDKSAGTLLTLASDYNNYWLKISPSLYNKEISIQCNDHSFITTLLFKNQKYPTIHVSKEVHGAGATGKTYETVISRCFVEGNSCNYEASLWAALALKSLGMDNPNSDISAFLPYLISMKDDFGNSIYIPDAFLYYLTGKFQEELLLLQKAGGYWEVSGSRFYDTALALLPFGYDDSLTAKTNAKTWLLTSQDRDGCWNHDNIRDTAFVLFSIWPKDTSPVLPPGVCEVDSDCPDISCQDKSCVNGDCSYTDVGCVSGDGCCGNGCTSSNDNDCIVVPCTTDSQCTNAGDAYSNPYCSGDNLYREAYTYYCDTSKHMCSQNQPTEELVETCTNGCTGNACVGGGGCTTGLLGLSDSCPSGQQCVNGNCVDKGGEDCSTGVPCPGTEYGGNTCSDDTTVSRDVLSYTCDTSSKTCQKQTNTEVVQTCAADEKCQDGECIIPPCTSSWIFGDSCPNGQTCDNGVCVTDNTTVVCTQDSDCPSTTYGGNHCSDDYTQVFKTAYTYTCDTSVSGGTCVDGTNEELVSTCNTDEICDSSTNDCVSNKDVCDGLFNWCQSGYHCDKGTCVPDNTTVICSTNSDCPSSYDGGDYCSPDNTQVLKMVHTYTCDTSVSGGTCVDDSNEQVVKTCASGESCDSGTAACITGGTTCSIFNWCDSGYHCDSGICVPDGECTSNTASADCPSKDCQQPTCVSGTCLYEYLGCVNNDFCCNPGCNYTNDNDCPPGPECTSDSQCSDSNYQDPEYCGGSNSNDVYITFHNYTCQNQVCKESITDKLIEECGGKQCSSGICYGIPTTCQTSDDCNPGQTCNSDGECITPTKCTSSSDCAAKEDCIGGVCIPYECKADADCPSGEICDAGTCITKIQCTSSSDCAAKEDCIGGVCIPYECRIDSDCPSGEICGDSQCIQKAECTTSSDCSAKEDCIGGSCIPYECKSDTDCSSGEICANEECTPKVGCSSSSDCSAKEDCIGNVCIAYECKKPDDCASGEICVNDECVTSTSCTSYLDCDYYENCVDGVCTPYSCQSDADCNGGYCVNGQCAGNQTQQDCVNDGGYYCTLEANCNNAQGNIMSDYFCEGLFICCDKQIPLKTCNEEGGHICTADEECISGNYIEVSDNLNSGEACCIGGTCGAINNITTYNCEDHDGVCKDSCDSDEISSSDYTCENQGQSCCILATSVCNKDGVCDSSSGETKSNCPEDCKKGKGWILIVVLLILIMLAVLGIVFRDKLRTQWIKLKDKLSGKKEKKKFEMPATMHPGPQGRILPRRILPPAPGQGQPMHPQYPPSRFPIRGAIPGSRYPVGQPRPGMPGTGMAHPQTPGQPGQQLGAQLRAQQLQSQSAQKASSEETADKTSEAVKSSTPSQQKSTEEKTEKEKSAKEQSTKKSEEKKDEKTKEKSKNNELDEVLKKLKEMGSK